METADLLVVVETLEKRVCFFEKENKRLKDLLEKHKNPKTSRNSSLTPSKDENRPKTNQSLRESSGKKSGGQLGREGKTLEMTSTPDQIIELRPDYCKSCGSSLIELPATKKQSRQVIDIPPIKAVYTEYQSFSKVCACGCQTVADFPKQVTAPISYGTKIESLIGYFHVISEWKGKGKPCSFSFLLNRCLLIIMFRKGQYVM